MRSKPKIQVLYEQKNGLLNNHPSLANFSENFSKKQQNLKDAGNYLLKMNESLTLLNKLKNPEELKNLNAEDLKKLYYLSIRKFSKGGDEIEAWIKTEEFDNGTELCTKEKMLKYLESMIKQRNKIVPIGEKEIQEVKMATSLATFENYNGQLDLLKENDPLNDYKEHKEIKDKLSSITEAYELQYDKYVIQDIAQSIKNDKIHYNDLTVELSKYTKYIRQIDRNNIDDFEQALAKSLNLGKDITSSIKNAFNRVEIKIPNAEFVRKKENYLSEISKPKSNLDGSRYGNYNLSLRKSA